MNERRQAPNLIWAAYQAVAMVLGLGALAVLCLCWLPFALILNPLLPRRWGQPFARRAIMVGFRGYLDFLGAFCACRFDLSGLDRLRDEAPLIIVANHPSLLDVVMIVSRLPDAVCVMKGELLDSVLFGAAARFAGYIPNHAPLEMILDARDELRRGAQLLIFPEGTRTRDFPVNSCQLTTGLIARGSGVAVQTLLIEFTSPYLGKEWPLFRPPQLPLGFRVRLGERYEPPKNAAAFATELERYFRAELAKASPSTASARR